MRGLQRDAEGAYRNFKRTFLPAPLGAHRRASGWPALDTAGAGPHRRARTGQGLDDGQPVRLRDGDCLKRLVQTL
jgi:hypothetical protein